MKNKSPSIGVVGAGPGGLATAVLLASQGLDVDIYESQEQVGGRTGRVQLGDFGFDMGPTFFLMPHVLQEVFAAAGRSLYDEVELSRLDPMYRLVIGQPDDLDVVIDATQDVDEMSRRIDLVNRRDGQRFHDFIAYNRQKLDHFESILRRPFRSAADLIRLDTLKALPLLSPTKSVQDINSKFFSHPAVQLAVGFQSKYLGMSPADCPSLFSILPFIEYEYGVWHPKGGCHALMQALARIFTDLGGKIRLGTPVRSAAFSGRKVTGLHLGGRQDGIFARHDHVVMNADAAWALKNLVPEHLRPKYTDRSLDRKKYSCSTYMLYLGIDGEVDLPHHTIRTSPDYQQNLTDISADNGYGGRLSEHPSYYVCNPSVTDETLAPQGQSSLYVLMPTPNTRADIDWSLESGWVRDGLIKAMQKDLGVDLTGRIVTEKRYTPDDWGGCNINFGATFNLSHSMDQLLHRRPRHRVPHTDGLWLAGGGTHPGSGLPVIFLSSQITAKLLLDEIGLPGYTTEPNVVVPPTPAQPAGKPALAIQ